MHSGSGDHASAQPQAPSQLPLDVLGNVAADRDYLLLFMQGKSITERL